MTKSSLPLLHQTFSVLPDNRSPLERAIELSLSHQLFSIELPQPFLFDAEQVPEYLLPYLASENLVTDWSPDDALSIRRETTKNQPIVYRQAGTLKGVSDAIKSFGGDVDIEKWYQYGGEPYHLRVIYWFDGVFTADSYYRLNARLEQAKSERDVIDLTLGLKADGDMVVGSSVQVTAVFSGGPYEPELDGVSGGRGEGGTIQILAKIEGHPLNDNN